MCFQCEDYLGYKCGYYEVPEEIRERILKEKPGLRPYLYVKLTPPPGPDKLGFYRYREPLDFVRITYGWYSDLPALVRHHSPTAIGNYAVIHGEQQWMLNVYLRNTYWRNRVIANLQREIRKHSEAQQGYAHVTFAGGHWNWGYVEARLTMSGASEWKDVLWRNHEELVKFLKNVLKEAKKRGYE